MRQLHDLMVVTLIILVVTVGVLVATVAMQGGKLNDLETRINTFETVRIEYVVPDGDGA